MAEVRRMGEKGKDMKWEYPTYKILPQDAQDKYGSFFKSMNKESQTYQVLLYLCRYGEITPSDAFFDRNIGSLRLGARICDLRKKGVRINTGRRTLTSERGATRSFAVYTLREE